MLLRYSIGYMYCDWHYISSVSNWNVTPKRKSDHTSCSFCWYLWNWWHHSLNFLFIIIEKFNSFYLDKILLIICIEKQWSTRHTDCLSSICVSSMSALFMTRTSLSTIQWATNDHLPSSHKKSHRREKNRDFSIF